MDVDGSILGCMSSMLGVVPSEYQQKFIDHLQAEVTARAATAVDAEGVK